MSNFSDSSCIVALATPVGQGAISVVRISGNSSRSIIQKVCQFLPDHLESHRIYYGFFKRYSNGTKLDEVLVSYFKAGKSFTGEETFEISCHGSPFIAREIVSELVLAGARMAGRGEFTFRAFMNGRIDLVQAESVLSMIQSESQQATAQALRQLEGRLSETLNQLEDATIYCLAHIEASIDFSTEGLDTLNHQELLSRLQWAIQEVDRLLSSYRHGKVVKDGFNLVLVGPPNVGKSSLLNALLGEDKAIVTEIAGTTRDVVVGSFYVNGVKINVLDTAGIRETFDVVEKIGIQKSRQAIQQADAVLCVFDCSRFVEDEVLSLIDSLPQEKIYLIGNKVDIAQETQEVLFKKTKRIVDDLKVGSSSDMQKIHFVSALNAADVDKLKTLIGNLVGSSLGSDQSVLSVARHFENLSGLREHLQEAIEQLDHRQSVELIAIPLKEALLKLQDTLGKHYDDQILDRVFKEFCLGK